MPDMGEGEEGRAGDEVGATRVAQSWDECDCDSSKAVQLWLEGQGSWRGFL